MPKNEWKKSAWQSNRESRLNKLRENSKSNNIRRNRKKFVLTERLKLRR